jgi:hypothetical protein
MRQVIHDLSDKTFIGDLDHRRIRALSRTAARGPGASIAEILSGGWRQSPSPLSLSSETLGGITPCLLQLGAGALAWRRVRGSDLAASRAAYRLRQAYRLHTLEADLHEREIVQAVARLWSMGIEPLLGKGWAVARLYPEPGLRPYGDIDLCVRTEQYAAAKQLLENPEGPGGAADLHCGLRWKRDGQAFSFLDDRRLGELYARSEKVRLGELEVRLLGAEDHLRCLCLHMLSHGACRPLWLCDIGAALESRPAAFDWDWFLHGDRRRTEWVIGALGLAHCLLGARLDGVPVAEQALRLPRWLVPTLLRQWGNGFRARSPLAAFFRRPAGLLAELPHHWPNGIEATVTVRGPFNEWPRLPFQLGAVALRAAWFLARAPESPAPIIE